MRTESARCILFLFQKLIALIFNSFLNNCYMKRCQNPRSNQRDAGSVYKGKQTTCVIVKRGLKFHCIVASRPSMIGKEVHI